jgi:hypothetical protein
MTTAGDLVNEVITRVGFDVSPDEGLAALNERHKTMCVRAEVLRSPIALVTVAGQSDYTLPTNAADVDRVLVDGQDATFAPDVAHGYGCGWAVVAQADGTSTLRILPAPDQDGQAVSVVAVIRPDDLTATDAPLVPPEFYRQLREGVAATFYADEPEQMSVADRMEARFDTACQELRTQLRRGRRAGPAQIRVAM